MNLMKHIKYSLYFLVLVASSVKPTAAFVNPLFDQSRRDAAAYVGNPEGAPANPLLFAPFDKKMVFIRVMNGINGAHLGYLSAVPDAQGRWSDYNWCAIAIVPTVAPYEDRLLSMPELQFKFIVYPNNKQVVTLSSPVAGQWRENDINSTNHLQRNSNDNYELPLFDNGGLGSWEAWFPLGNPSNFVMKNFEDGRLLCKEASSLYVKAYMTKYNVNKSWAQLSKGIPPLVFELMTVDQLRDAINQRNAAAAAQQQAAAQAAQAATAEVTQALATIKTFKDPVSSAADQAEGAATTIDGLLSTVQAALQSLKASDAQDAAKNALIQVKILENALKVSQDNFTQAQAIAVRYPATNGVADLAIRQSIAAVFNEITANKGRVEAALARGKSVNQQIQDGASTTAKSAASQADLDARVAKFAKLGVASGSYVALQIVSQTTNTDKYLVCSAVGLLAANGESLLDPSTHLQIISNDGLVSLGVVGKRIKIDKAQGSKAFVVAAGALDDSQLFEVDGVRTECYLLSKLNKGALTILPDATFGVVDNNSSKLLPLTKTMDAAFRIIPISTLQHELALAQSKSSTDRLNVYIAQSKKARTADDRELLVRAILDFVTNSQKVPATWKAVKQEIGDQLVGFVGTLLNDPAYADQKVYVGQINDKVTADDRQAAADAEKNKAAALARNQAFNRLGLGSVTIIALKSRATGNYLTVTAGKFDRSVPAQKGAPAGTVSVDVGYLKADGEDQLASACQFQILRNPDGWVGLRSSVVGDKVLQAQPVDGEQPGMARFVRTDFSDLEFFEVEGAADGLYLKHKVTGGYLTVAEDGTVSVNDPVASGFMPAEKLDSAAFEIVKLSAIHREVALLAGKPAKDKITRLDGLVRDRKATTEDTRRLIVDTFKSIIDDATADKASWATVKADVVNVAKVFIQRMRSAAKEYGAYETDIKAIEDKVLADERAQEKTAGQLKADAEARNQRVNRLGITGGLVMIQCQLNGKNIRAMDDGSLKVDGSDPLDLACQWQCVRTADGYLTIKSVATGKVLYAQQAAPSAGKVLLGDAATVPAADQLFAADGTKDEGYLQHVSTKGYLFLTNDGDLVINDPASDMFLPTQKSSDTALRFIVVSSVARDVAAQKAKPLKDRLRSFPMMLNRATTPDAQAILMTTLRGYVDEVQPSFDAWEKAKVDAELIASLKAAVTSAQGSGKFDAQKADLDQLASRLDDTSALSPKWTIVEPQKTLGFAARVTAVSDQLVKMPYPTVDQKKTLLDVLKGIGDDRIAASSAEISSLKALLLKLKQGFYKGKDDASFRNDIDAQIKILSGGASVADKMAFVKGLYDDGLIDPAKNKLFISKLNELSPLMASATDGDRKQLQDFLNGVLQEAEYAPELKKVVPVIRRVLESLSTIDDAAIEDNANKEMPAEGTQVLVTSLKNGKYLRLDGKDLKADGDDSLSQASQFAVVRARGAMTLKTLMDSGVVLKSLGAKEAGAGSAVMVDTQYADEKSIAAQWDMIGKQANFSLQNRGTQGLLSTQDDGSLVTLDNSNKPIAKSGGEAYKFTILTQFMRDLSAARKLGDAERLSAYLFTLLAQAKTPADKALFVGEVASFVMLKQQNKASWDAFSDNEALWGLLQSLMNTLMTNADFAGQKAAISALNEKILSAELADDEPYAPIAERLKRFNDQVKGLKSASKQVKTSFVASLERLVNDRADATPPQDKSIGELLKVAKFNVFTADDENRKKMDALVAKATRPLTFSDRVGAVKALYQKGLTTAELKKLFLTRLQSTLLARSGASLDQLNELASFVNATLEEVKYIDDLQDLIKPLTQLAASIKPLLNASAGAAAEPNKEVPANKSIVAFQVAQSNKFVRVVDGKYLVADASDYSSNDCLFEVALAANGNMMLKALGSKQLIGSPAQGQPDAGAVLVTLGAGDVSQQFIFEGTRLATSLKNNATQGYVTVTADGKLVTATASEEDDSQLNPEEKSDAGFFRTIVLSDFEQSLARAQGLADADRLALYTQSAFKATQPSEQTAIIAGLSSFVDAKRSKSTTWQQFTANKSLAGQLDLLLNSLANNPAFSAQKDKVQEVIAKVKGIAGSLADGDEQKDQRLSFAERVTRLTQSMKMLSPKNEEQVNAFMDGVAQAVNGRVDATPRDISAFKALLTRAQTIFRSDKRIKDQLIDAAKRTEEAVPFSDRYELVQDMIDDGVVTKEEQDLLIRRLRALITDLKTANGDERKEFETLVSDFAETVEYDDSLKGLKRGMADVKTVLAKALKNLPAAEAAQPKADVPKAAVVVSNVSLSFQDRITAAGKVMQTVKTDEQRDQFLGTLQQIVNSRTPADSNVELIKLLKASDMFVFKSDVSRSSQLQALIEQASKKLSLADIIADAQQKFDGDLTTVSAVEALVAQLTVISQAVVQATADEQENARTLLTSIKAAAEYSPLLKEKVAMIDDALKKLAGPKDQILGLLGSINTPKDDEGRRQLVANLKTAFLSLRSNQVQWNKLKADQAAFTGVLNVIKAYLYNPAYRAFGSDIKQLELLSNIGTTQQIMVAPNQSQALWLIEDQFVFQTPGRGVFSALVRAASTDLKIVIATDPKDDAPGYELTVGEAFSGQENQQTILRHNGSPEILVQTDKDDNSGAVLVPGTQETIWVKIDGALVSFGKGDLGSEPFLSYIDPEAVNGVRFVGLRSAAKPYNVGSLAVKAL